MIASYIKVVSFSSYHTLDATAFQIYFIFPNHLQDAKPISIFEFINKIWRGEYFPNSDTLKPL